MSPLFPFSSVSDNDLKNNTYLLQDEERDPLLHSFSHLKEVLNSITGESSHLCKIIYLGKKDMCLIYCRDGKTFF